MDRLIKKRKWTIKRIIILTGAGTVMAILMTMFINSTGGAKLNVEQERLRISTVVHGNFQEFIPVNGEVLPLHTVYLDAIEGGIVEEIYLESGDIVEKGTPILKLGNPSLELNYMSQETQIMDQINNMSNTRIAVEEQTLRLKEQLLETSYQLINYEKKFHLNKQLLEKGAVAKSRFDEIRDQFEYYLRKKDLIEQKIRQDSILRIMQINQLEPSIRLMQRNLDAISAAVENLVVKAPVSGQLSSLKAELGQNVQQGENIAQMDMMEGFKLRASVDEHYISRVKTGQSAHFDFEDGKYKLVVIKVFPEVNNGTFNIDLKFIADVPENIKRGQTFQLKLALSAATESLLLARGTFYQKTGSNWVYLLSGNGTTAEKQPIRLGRQNPQYYEVLEGLREGDKVITSSYANFNNADQLNLK